MRFGRLYAYLRRHDDWVVIGFFGVLGIIRLLIVIFGSDDIDDGWGGGFRGGGGFGGGGFGGGGFGGGGGFSGGGGSSGGGGASGHW